MSKAFYPVAGGTARAGKMVYVVLSGLTRKVKAGYAVRGDVHRQFYSAGPLVSFSGAHTISDITIDGKAYKLLTMTGSGMLTVAGEGVQYWICGGGASGENAWYEMRNGYGTGRGGCGGHVASGTIMSGTWTIIIGAGGTTPGMASNHQKGIYSAGGNTEMAKGTTSHTANGGTLESGGSGGGYAWSSTGTSQYSKIDGGVGDGVSTYPFGVSSLFAHSAGGGSGSIIGWTRLGMCDGGTNGGDGTTSSSSTQASGGEKGGGAGGVFMSGVTDSPNGEGATFFGSAGGGASVSTSSSWRNQFGTGGAGYQGVAYVLVPAA